MMQTKKEHTRSLLLDTARNAFSERGYSAVSMRDISRLSGVGLSNIYNYFPHKESLLMTVLHPLLRRIDKMLMDHNIPKNISVDIFTSEEVQHEWLDETFDIVNTYRKEMKLFFSVSQEPQFEDLTNKWISRGTEVGNEYLKLMGTHYPHLHTEISTMFMRFMSSCWLNMMKEVLEHDDLTKEEIQRFINEYIHFSTGGWRTLMQAVPNAPTINNNHLP